MENITEHDYESVVSGYEHLAEFMDFAHKVNSFLGDNHAGMFKFYENEYADFIYQNIKRDSIKASIERDNLRAEWSSSRLLQITYPTYDEYHQSMLEEIIDLNEGISKSAEALTTGVCTVGFEVCCANSPIVPFGSRSWDNTQNADEVIQGVIAELEHLEVSYSIKDNNQVGLVRKGFEVVFKKGG